MKRILAAGLFFLSLSAFGQYPYYGDRGGYRDRDGYYRDDQDRYRDDRYRDDRYRDPRYGRSSVVDRVISDLDRASFRGWGGRERDNASDARNNLYNFASRWQQGRFETKYLDRAIDHLKVLAYSGRTDPRTRSLIARDIDDLRAFRAGGGYRGGGYYRGY